MITERRRALIRRLFAIAAIAGFFAFAFSVNAGDADDSIIWIAWFAVTVVAAGKAVYRYFFD
jgi:hypothetical protein